MCVCASSVCVVRYLQRLDWPLHKAECKIVGGGKLEFKILGGGSLARLTLRALTRDTQHFCSRKRQLLNNVM